LANLAVKIVSLDVPNDIESISDGDTPGTIILAPRIDCFSCYLSAEQGFDRVEELFEFFFAGKRCVAFASRTLNSEKDVVKKILQTLETFVKNEIAIIPTTRSLRCVLSHKDLDDDNIVANSRTGLITGLIDRKLHLTAPPFLAAEYPHFPRRYWAYVPRFTDTNRWYLASAEECARLNDLFGQVGCNELRYRNIVLTACFRWSKASRKNATGYLSQVKH
jgi:hypothetical protein